MARLRARFPPAEKPEIQSLVVSSAIFDFILNVDDGDAAFECGCAAFAFNRSLFRFCI
jgi:hypothetical protein